MVSEKLLENLNIKRADKISRVLSVKKKPSKKEINKKEINIIYKYEEDEERLNRVFDMIFEEVIRRRKEKQRY